MTKTHKPAKPLIGMNTAALRAIAVELGEASFRGNQLVEWLYHRGAREFGVMSNLPESFRHKLTEQYTIGRLAVVTTQQSTDGTVKLLLEMPDSARIETVGLPYSERYSCCVSTQAGCPIGCAFCATGRSGFQRNLSAGEIVDQMLSINESVTNASTAQSHPVDHVTFMGMGEPLLNYDATVKALGLFSQEMGISARRLTVSTIGHVPGIKRLAREGIPVTLAVSLHAADDNLRQQLIPGLRFSLAEIIAAGREYVTVTGRRITVEYCLLDDVNDRPDDALKLALILKGLNCHVNLIPFNPAEGVLFKPSPPVKVKTFQLALEKQGITVTARLRRGADIDAACGQLRNRDA
ncbi:MAG: 23S rRNA (adenine(2503)-C(2))-methyltransferase RlmN [Dehalogenimonas sp.]